MSSQYITPVTLKGNVVTLAPLKSEHGLELFLALQTDPEIWRYLSAPYPGTAEKMAESIAGVLEDQARGQRLPFVVLDNATGRVLGTTSYLDISAEHRHLEIGWTWYARDCWRTAVNTECKYLLLRHAFETLGCIRVQLRTDERNQRSRSAIERIGGVLEGVIREDRVMPDGFHRSSAQYSLLATEWPARRGWFESRLHGP